MDRWDSLQGIVCTQEAVAKEKEETEKKRRLQVKTKTPSAAPPVSSGLGRRTSKENPRKFLGQNSLNSSLAVLNSSASSSFTSESYSTHELSNILKINLDSLKKKSCELSEAWERLDRDKLLHIREIKRIQREDSSRFNNFPVLKERYLLLNLLGTGGFSEVYRAMDLHELNYVACKIQQMNSSWSATHKMDHLRHMKREFQIQTKLDHPRIVHQLDIFQLDEKAFCSVLEYCEGHDLEFHLKQNRQLSEKVAKVLLIQIVKALQYLNQLHPPIIHYDLKPGNILLKAESQYLEIMLTDFGLSKQMDNLNDEIELTCQGAGTYWYLPPECFVAGNTAPMISSKVDVWSVGVIFYQMLYGQKPFGNDMSQNAFYEANMMRKPLEVAFPAKPVVTSMAQQFIKKCLTYNKEDRPDVLTLAQEPYLVTNGRNK